MTQSRAGTGAGDRDSFLDALRAVAILRVVFWHTYGAAWISYFVASLPVMFFVAGSLMSLSLSRGNTFDVLFRRFKRLLLPLWLMTAVAIAVMVAYDRTSDAFSATVQLRDAVWWLFPLWDPRGSDWGITWWAPLWYLRCLTWLLLLSPLLLYLWRRVGPGLLLLPALGIALTEQSLNSGLNVPWQLQDLALYSFFWLLGFAYNDGLLTALPRRICLVLCAGFATWAAAWAYTQNVPANIVNASYPLHLLVALAWLFGALSFRAAISSFALRPRVDAVIYWVNERALTIYLWHAAGLFCMYQILWAEPHSRLEHWLLALPIVVSVTLLAVLLFGWVEDLAASRSLRLWPVRRREPGRRRLFVGPGHLLPATAALAGFVAVVIGAGGIIQEPGTAVQPGQNTMPASGVGLHLRTERAEITEDAPEREPPPQVITPVTAEELQAELDAWYQVWPIAGAAVSLYRNPGDAWSGATGFYEDGSVFLLDEQYWIGSVTKTFTIALVMRLTEWGLIDLDEPVSNFAPDFPESERFTVRQLIQHTSGLVVGDEAPYDALVTAAAAGLQFEPGTDFEYSRAGYYLLGLVIEDRLDKSYVQVLRDELLDPLQLSNTQMDSEIEPLKYSTHPYAELAAGYGGVTWSSGGLHRELNGEIDYRGTHWSSAGLYSTTQDLARWSAALWGSDFVVSPHSRDLMTTFLDENFDFTGLGTYAICPCWLDGERLRAERWGHLGATGAIEYDPIDGVALAVHVSGSITDTSVLESIDDLSARLRGILRGRPLVVDAALSTRAALPDITDPRLGLTCKEVAGLSGVDEQLRAWFDDACVGQPLAGMMARRSCDEIAGTTYRSEQERLFYLRACPHPEPVENGVPIEGEEGSETEPGAEDGLGPDGTPVAPGDSDDESVTPTPPTPPAAPLP